MLALTGAVISFILKCFGWKGAPLAAIASILALISLFEPYFEKIIELFYTVSDVAEIKDGAKTLVKVVGVGYLSGISSDVCRELGENGIASAVTTVGRVEVLLIILPVFCEVLGLGLELAL